MFQGNWKGADPMRTWMAGLSGDPMLSFASSQDTRSQTGRLATLETSHLDGCMLFLAPTQTLLPDYTDIC
ncbi:unnamed protein product [Penicillium roqueforti FM164]|uniref:Genomic scaffold, ProqFM164S01 n=1 Tax=Penicillium roqueforti (strain FM164) TaxID=1365484 RepID=W6QH45_PENRF|nr:unnamed protein product [Penicillium roqueforti FM164]